MVSGVMVGILREQHSDHIILGDSSRVDLPDGLVLERFPSACSVTILYSLDAGHLVVKSITPSATSYLRHLPSYGATNHTREGYTKA
jgi:hypothetical protein